MLLILCLLFMNSMVFSVLPPIVNFQETATLDNTDWTLSCGDVNGNQLSIFTDFQSANYFTSTIDHIAEYFETNFTTNLNCSLDIVYEDVTSVIRSYCLNRYKCRIPKSALNLKSSCKTSKNYETILYEGACGYGNIGLLNSMQIHDGPTITITSALAQHSHCNLSFNSPMSSVHVLNSVTAGSYVNLSLTGSTSQNERTIVSTDCECSSCKSNTALTATHFGQLCTRPNPTGHVAE